MLKYNSSLLSDRDKIQDRPGLISYVPKLKAPALNVRTSRAWTEYGT